MFISLTSVLVKVLPLILSLTLTKMSYADKDTISLEQVTKDVTYLASDTLKGRNNYSPEIRIAAKYIAERFQENGLVGMNGISKTNYLQKYQVINLIPKKLNVVINGENVSPENLAMASTVVNFSWNMQGITKSTSFKIHNVSQNDDMQAIVSKLNNQGGEHLVLLHPAHKTLFKRYQNYFQQGTTRLAQQNSNKNSTGVIVLALSENTAEKVDSLSVSGFSTVGNNEFINVVGVLEGKTKPEEIILYSAHYDHLGTKEDQSNIIFNGADDNASGTTAILNLVEYYANKGNNARTLMFAAFSAEEIGGFGSKYFSMQLEPKAITAMINIEMVGKSSKFGSGTLWMTGMERSTLGAQLNQTLASSGKKIYKDPYPEQGLFYRSDNASLARLGVPAHTFSSAQLDQDQHYHQTSDDISSLNLSSLHQVIEMLATATQPLVNGSITPSRIDENLVIGKGVIF
jgi:aminopeptidase YwaD